MSDWKWDYNPSEEYLTAGLPVGVVAEVERIATEIAALGRDAEGAGSRPEPPGGYLKKAIPSSGMSSGRAFAQRSTSSGVTTFFRCADM
ncbi:hypothetical protein LZP81_29375 [Streptomyces parvulus]|uniref:Uncharacterized protein n=1 Tax=Streptomyces parvulus TaxID=146923 RepID=A0ABV5DL51_9ACTN|nr:hypothetical protein [Streptomyces parvulus]MCC9158076.1 hypothetical protein [Streptomyces parvulus]MCE7690973.1 hypothetical protein [Streptomyces parvulus]